MWLLECGVSDAMFGIFIAADIPWLMSFHMSVHDQEISWPHMESANGVSFPEYCVRIRTAMTNSSLGKTWISEAYFSYKERFWRLYKWIINFNSTTGLVRKQGIYGCVWAIGELSRIGSWNNVLGTGENFPFIGNWRLCLTYWIF